MTALGQQRKSSVRLGMSVPGGIADFDFGRLEVCSWDSDSLAISYVHAIINWVFEKALKPNSQIVPQAQQIATPRRPGG